VKSSKIWWGQRILWIISIWMVSLSGLLSGKNAVAFGTGHYWFTGALKMMPTLPPKKGEHPLISYYLAHLTSVFQARLAKLPDDHPITLNEYA